MNDVAAHRAAVERAICSEGRSQDAIHAMVARAIDEAGVRGTLIDVGCGRGDLLRALAGKFDRPTGVDIVRYDDFPGGATFVAADLNAHPYPVPDASADVVAAVETIEHLENPRAFVRELARIVKPGGVVVVTTPNQLSFLSKLTLVVKNRFNAFQDAHYPAHLSALLEVDLLRIAKECGLEDARIRYSDSGRIPFTARRWPWPLRGRTFSDNILLSARRPRS